MKTAQRAELRAALHDFRSLYNVGSVFRSASGAGLGKLYLSGFTGTPPQAGIAKVALGAEQEVAWQQCIKVADLLHDLQGQQVIAIEQHGSSLPYWEVELDRSRPVTIVLGGELTGLPGELLERADAVAEIPMAGDKESLNVASAFAIVAYDFSRRLGIVGAEQLRSRDPRPPRPGVLTDGPTINERPAG